MTSRKRVSKELDLAGEEYDACWSILRDLRDGKLKDSQNKFFTFQPRLAKALFRLDQLYREIHQSKESLISRKKHLDYSWFKARMRALAGYQKAIKEMISIGKALGDSFAWFFYQKNSNYLTEHLSHEKISHTPPGIGGIGELEFVKNTPVLEGFAVIYHGITNILRLGDISLIDLKEFKVAGIGELKSSSPREGVVSVNLLVTDRGLDTLKIKVSENKDKTNSNYFVESLPKSMKDRLKRQLERIEDSFETLANPADKTYKSVSQELGSHVSKLENMIKGARVGKLTVDVIGKGLVVCVYRQSCRKWISKLEASNKASEFDLSVLVESSEKVIRSDRQDNSLLFGTLLYGKSGEPSYLPGMTHHSWWPMDAAVIKDIVFQNVIVFTLLNPAHLIHEFEKNNFSIIGTEIFDMKVSKRMGKKVFEVVGMGHYLQMIQHYLFPESSIVDSIVSVESELNTFVSEDSQAIGIRLLFDQKL